MLGDERPRHQHGCQTGRLGMFSVADKLGGLVPQPSPVIAQQNLSNAKVLAPKVP